MEKQTLYRAMHDADRFVVTLDYVDAKGHVTSRVVSPIRFLGQDRFLALCLCRCEPRQFQLQRCSNISLRPAAHYTMPVNITEALPVAV